MGQPRWIEPQGSLEDLDEERLAALQTRLELLAGLQEDEEGYEGLLDEDVEHRMTSRETTSPTRVVRIWKSLSAGRAGGVQVIGVDKMRNDSRTDMDARWL